MKNAWLAVVLVVWSAASWAQPVLLPEVEKLMAQTEAPEGVVFELLSREPNFVAKRAKLIEHQVSELKKRFPNLDISIVSHGRELAEFSSQGAHLEVFKTLSEQQSVNLHVCGTVAQRLTIDENRFAEFVDITPSGTAQLNDYRKLGYVVIRIR
jgi:intracellular sulfur oxidation DsrE/DsrF family protein